MKRRLTSLLLVLAMVFTLLPIQAFAVDTAKSADTANPFEDVKQGSWYYDAVQYVRVNGLFNGVSETIFWPQGTMTRGMFVTVLGRMAGVDPDKYTGPSAFTDVPENAYYAPYVAWASKYGITVGTGDGKFSPDANINRQQMATFLVRYFETFDVDYETNANITTEPADIDSVSSWSRDAVLKLWRTGLLVGDGGEFMPFSNATRAQAATVFTRTDEVVNTWYSEPGVPSARVRINPDTGLPYDNGSEPTEPTHGNGNGGSGSSGGGSGNQGSTTTTYYEVDFQPGAGMDSLGAVLPEKKTYASGTALTSLPTPTGEYLAFLGWYLDRELTQPVASDAVLSSNLTLYAKLASIDAAVAELQTPSYITQIIKPDDVGSFTLKLGGTFANAKADLTITKVSAVNENVEFTVAPDGTVTPAGGWEPGHTYKAELAEDSPAVFIQNGASQPQSVRVFNLVFEKGEVQNLQLDCDIKYIPRTAVTYAAGDPIGGLFSASLQQGANGETLPVTQVNQTGEFTYSANGSLSVGDTVAIYEGTRPDQRETGSDSDTVVYVEITDVSGDRYSYKTADAEDVLFTPDVLPVSVSADTDGDDANGSITVAAATFNFYDALYAQMGLDATTTVDVGDFLAFYEGEFQTAASVTYGKITDITVNEDGTYTVAYDAAAEADVIASMDIYSTRKQEISLTPEEIAAIEDDLRTQAIESGFADEAAMYLASLALETDGFQELSGGFDLESYTVTYSKSAARGGAKNRVSITKQEIKPQIHIGNLDHFDDSNGIRAELVMDLEITVDIGGGNSIVITLQAVFEQEVFLSVNTSGGAVWKWAGIFPYIDDYRLNANIDVGTYTGIGITATAKTKGEDDEEFDWKPATGYKAEEMIIDIGKQVTELMKQKDKFLGKDLIDNGDDDDDDDGGIPISGGLAEKYAAMIEDADDSWIELFRKEIFSVEGSVDPFHILCFGISADFVVSANLYVTLGLTFNYESAKRYNFSVMLFSRKSTNDVIDLTPEHYSFDFYVMGTVGVRAGVEFEIGVGLFSLKLDSIGICAEAGAYAQLWGYFYYHLNWDKQSNRRESGFSGALLIEIGIYLKVSFKAQLFSSDKLTYQPTLYENQWPILTIGDQENVFEFADLEAADDEYGDPESFAVEVATSLPLPAELFVMKYMDMQSGEVGGELDEKTGKLKKPGRDCSEEISKYFIISFSDPEHFSFDPVTRTVTITPKGKSALNAEMDIIWKNGTLAFSSKPIQRTVSIAWSDPANRRYISFDSRGGKAVRMVVGDPGDEIKWPKDPTRLGYDFAGWYEDAALTVPYTVPETMPAFTPENRGILLYAKWTPRHDTKYTVEHYLQEINTSYVLYETDKTLFGTTEAQTAAAPRTQGRYAHFTPKPFEQTEILPDGSAVVRIYYTRDKHNVSFSYGEFASAENPAMNFQVKFEGTAYEPIMSLKGYKFAAFTPATGADKNGGFRIENDMTFAATWTPRSDTPYRVEHYWQNADGNGYTIHEIEKMQGTTGATAAAAAKAYENFTLNSAATGTLSSGAIAADGSLALKLYYDRQSVTVTYDADGGAMSDGSTGTFLWGAPFIGPVPTKEDSALIGWFKADGTQLKDGDAVKESMTLTARWKAGAVNYKVEHYVMDTDGSYPATPAKTTVAVGDKGENVTLSTLRDSALEVDGGIAYAKAEIYGAEQTTAAVSKNMTVSLYYTRQQHTLTWDIGGNSTTETLYFGAPVTAKIPEDGYHYEWIDAPEETMPAMDVSYSASKLPNVFTVHFDANGGTGAMADLEYTVGTEKTVKNTLALGTYTFMGWSATKAGAVTYPVDTADNVSTVLKGLTAEHGGEITLYAQWDAGNRIIYADADNLANYDELPKEYEPGTKTELPAGVMKSGEPFLIWCTNPEDPWTTRMSAIASSSTGTVTLYAKYAEGGVIKTPEDLSKLDSSNWESIGGDFADTHYTAKLKAATFKLANDITLTTDWEMVKNMDVSFDGCGHTITIPDDDSAQPVFARIDHNSGTNQVDAVSNLNIKIGKLKVDYDALGYSVYSENDYTPDSQKVHVDFKAWGALAGSVTNGTVRNCTVTGIDEQSGVTVDVDGQRLIDDFSIFRNFEKKRYVTSTRLPIGGLLGETGTWGKVIDCTVGEEGAPLTIKVQGDCARYVGGLVGLGAGITQFTKDAKIYVDIDIAEYAEGAGGVIGGHAGVTIDVPTSFEAYVTINAPNARSVGGMIGDTLAEKASYASNNTNSLRSIGAGSCVVICVLTGGGTGTDPEGTAFTGYTGGLFGRGYNAASERKPLLDQYGQHVTNSDGSWKYETVYTVSQSNVTVKNSTITAGSGGGAHIFCGEAKEVCGFDGGGNTVSPG